MTEHTISTDFVVVGGGLAGVCAAIAAARTGAKVVLVQDRSVLGGNASSEVKMHIVGADCHGSRVGARETGLIEELKLEDAARNPHRSYSQWDLLLYEKVTAEPDLTLLLDSACIGCTVETVSNQRRITSVKVLRNSTEDVFDIRAPYFADCSGDGRLGSEAGAEFTVGREAKSQYGESHALDVADRHTLGSSILFTARKYDSPQGFLPPSWTRKFTRADFKHRPIPSYEYGYWWFEWGGHLDTLKDNALIRHELLRIALGIWDYVKNSGDHPESANWALDWVGAIPGKRESRRFLGPHVLTQNDVESGRIFEDQVAYGGWWLDLHPPQGLDAIDEEPCLQIHFPHLYSIPLRALYSRNVANLFFAGRNMSASHVAFASTRVMGTCAVMGQAIGTAAALAVKQAGPRAIAEVFTASRMHALQQTLLRDDAFLPGISAEDPSDLAPRAALRSTSESPSGASLNVVDGVTRELFPHLGTWADGRPHRWESLSLPATLELTWSEPQLISELRFTFDSGLDRELILSASDWTTRRVVRGAQPEIARDYDVFVDEARVVSMRGNFLRHRAHRLAEPRRGSQVRLVVLATNGAPTARVFEVRLY